MINLIRILENRTLLISSKIIGVQDESNAEILKIAKPPKINGEDISNFTAKPIFKNKNGSFTNKVFDSNDEIKLTPELTSDDFLEFSVYFLKGNEVIWKSKPITLYLHNDIDNSGNNIVEDTENRIKQELIDAVSEATGEEYSDDITFEELFEIISEFDLEEYLTNFRFSMIALLPTFHLNLMNNEQFKFTIRQIISTLAECDTSNTNRLLLASSSAKLNSDGSLSVNSDGMPNLIMTIERGVTQEEIEQMIYDAQEDYRDLISGMEEILGITGGDSDE